MNLKPIASNMTLLELNNGNIVLFSYQTPVAFKMMGLSAVYVTDRYYSRTTNKHITKWINSFQYEVPRVTVLQSDIDKLVK